MTERASSRDSIFTIESLGVSGHFDDWAVTFASCSEHLTLAPNEIERWRDSNSPLVVSRVGPPNPSFYRLRWEGLTVDVLPGRRMVARVRRGTPRITIDHFLADQVMPRVMAHDGAFILHSGAVRVANHAILVMGPSGRGKSTLSKSFDNAGFALMGDDAIVISQSGGQHFARTIYPSLRLLPDSIEALLKVDTATADVSHYSPKQRVDLPVSAVRHTAPVPIVAIFSIASPTSDSQVRLRRFSITDACMAFVESSFALDPSDTLRARERLDDASALAREVPTFEISYPRDYARLPEVRQAILNQVALEIA